MASTANFITFSLKIMKTLWHKYLISLFKQQHIAMLSLILSISLLSVNAQTESDAEIFKRTNNFSSIKDGVYYSFADVKANKPSLDKDHLVKSYDHNIAFTLSGWATTENLYYLDAQNIKRKVNRDSLWGYVENGTPFIYLNGKFHKFSTIGTISVFTESYPTVQTMSPVMTDFHSGTFQRLFDFNTGQIADYDADNLAMMIAKDQNMFNEFNELKTLKAKRKKMYRFIEKYNDNYRLIP